MSEYQLELDLYNVCPACGKPVYISEHWEEWACSDWQCIKAHGPAPGGGYSLPVPTKEEQP